MTVRTRMAPSPTGEYHIGHIRTVLYNYALARQAGGKFIIRIEDTDRERFVEGATERILSVIKAYGLDWDEGPEMGGPHEPYFQSQRLDIYKEYANQLVQSGYAYPCFCTTERLTKLREEQREKGMPVTKYDRHCLSLPKSEVTERLARGEGHVIRLKVPEGENITFHDAVVGEVSINSDDIDDQVLIKSDGFPTYQLAVVVDDHLMGVTHVMRGSDWIPSTPKHVLLYRYLGWEMPIHIHLPNLKELGGSRKLSKRYGSVSALEFLEEGYLPRALLNFLMFLGWNPGTEQEIFNLNEFIKQFSIKRLQKSDLVAFDREKLKWFNAWYIRNTQTAPLWRELTSWGKQYSVEINGSHLADALNHRILELVKDRMHLLSDFNLLTGYFYIAPTVDKNLLGKFTKDLARAKAIISDLNRVLSEIQGSNWQTEKLDKICHDMIQIQGYSPKEAFMTLRVAVTGETATPPIFDILSVLGKDETMLRLEKVSIEAV